MFKSHFSSELYRIGGQIGGIKTQKRRLKENVSGRKETSGSNFKSVESADMQSVWNLMN